MKPVEEVLRDLPRNYRETAMTLAALQCADEVEKLLTSDDTFVTTADLRAWVKVTREIHGEQE